MIFHLFLDGLVDRPWHGSRTHGVHNVVSHSESFTFSSLGDFHLTAPGTLVFPPSGTSGGSRSLDLYGRPRHLRRRLNESRENGTKYLHDRPVTTVRPSQLPPVITPSRYHWSLEQFARTHLVLCLSFTPKRGYP